MSHAKKLRILMLDDDKFTLEFVTDLLIQLGISEVLVAQDGKAGLSVLAAQTKNVDLLICDIEMPGMDGIAFLRNIANQGYTGKIVLFSGIDEDLMKAAERLAKARGLNVIDTLKKPITVGALAGVLMQLSKPFQKKIGNDRNELIIEAEDIRQALDSNQIVIFYQPKVSLSDNHVTGVECFARWYHAEYGLVYPGDFISIVEQNDLINDFTLYILRNAVKQLAAWQRLGLDLKIAINISIDNLNRCDLPEIFEEIVLQESGVSTESIILETTGSKLIKDFALSLDILTRLRLKGFGLSIGNFGTGYASLEKLKDLPFTELKIDKVFTNSAVDEPSARAIVELSTRLGKIFNLNLVAQGIEKEADKDLIAELGCKEAQGYYIAKPMPGEHFVKWMRQYEETSKQNYLANT